MLLRGTIVFVVLIQGITSAAEAQEQNPSVAERQAAMRVLARDKTATASVVLPLVEAGLVDADDRVRIFASIALSQLIARTPPGAEHQRELRRPSLWNVLAAGLDDPEYMVRVGAIQHLRATGALAIEEHRRALIARYDRETDTRVRHVIVDSVRAHAAEPEVGALLLRALDDPSVDVRGSAATAVAATRAPEALPAIVRELQSGEQGTRREFLNALAMFGAAAKEYVPVLERLRFLEADPVRRRDIDRALDAILGERQR